METLPELRARHRRERRELVEAHTDFTLCQAAKLLDADPSQLRTYAWHNGISFASMNYKGRTAVKRD